MLAPSLVNDASYAELGDMGAWADCGNIHPYSGGDVPDITLAELSDRARTISPGDPVCVTEAGYHNALLTAEGHRPASEAAAGSYMPRLYLDYLRAGVARTFIYELVDAWPDSAGTEQDSHFGRCATTSARSPPSARCRT